MVENVIKQFAASRMYSKRANFKGNVKRYKKGNQTFENKEYHLCNHGSNLKQIN